MLVLGKGRLQFSRLCSRYLAGSHREVDVNLSLLHLGRKISLHFATLYVCMAESGRYCPSNRGCMKLEVYHPLSFNGLVLCIVHSTAYDVALNDDTWPSDIFDIEGNATRTWGSIEP